ncbi:hypothetical protein PSHT_14009 [Puccinia striiformis]|uniref:Uncharacterized protein n=1 Tax=Puccinia striiformis TaxID=27350 RepID=A0A2S4UME4_9BASI|nr:hypothetical protein PSHT_14009 [Puccinia striiformis]
MSFRAAMKHWYDPAYKGDTLNFSYFGSNSTLRPFRSVSQCLFPIVQVKRESILICYLSILDVVIGTAMGGAGWYLTRLARGPDIIWARHSNPQPWNDVKPGQTTKLMSVNQEFPNGSYKRDKF